MNLQNYVLSSLIHDEEALRYGIINLKKQYFTDKAYQFLFSLIVSKYQEREQLTKGVWHSLGSTQGFPEEELEEIWNASIDSFDDFKPNFAEFIRLATHRKIAQDIAHLDHLRSHKTPKELAKSAQTLITSWTTGQVKRYASGAEIDQMGEVFTDLVLTGIKAIDEGVYAGGGNAKGQMTGFIAREKHGKTRYASFEVANNLRSGHKILYVALEGRSREIANKICQAMGEEDWMRYRQNLFVLEGVYDLDDIVAEVISAVVVDGVDKVVVDYLQKVDAEGNSENERISNASDRFAKLMVTYNFNCLVLAQNKQEDSSRSSSGNMPDDYKHIPSAYDMYGSKQLLKDCSLLVSGFRPNLYKGLHLDYRSSILGIDNESADWNTFYLFPIRSREENEYVGNALQLVDSQFGFRVRNWQYEDY